MHQEKYWASKVPLSLALLFVLNILLVVAAELLFVYRYPAQPDAASLEKYGSAYEECRILNKDSVNYLTASLVQTHDGQMHLVVTKAHEVAFGRGKILYAEPVEIPDKEEIAVFVKNGIHTSEIRIQAIPSGVPAVTVHYGYSGGIREASALYMLLAASLEAIELLVLHLIKRNLT